MQDASEQRRDGQDQTGVQRRDVGNRQFPTEHPTVGMVASPEKECATRLSVGDGEYQRDQTDAQKQPE